LDGASWSIAAQVSIESGFQARRGSAPVSVACRDIDHREAESAGLQRGLDREPDEERAGWSSPPRISRRRTVSRSTSWHLPPSAGAAMIGQHTKAALALPNARHEVWKRARSLAWYAEMEQPEPPTSLLLSACPCIAQDGAVDMGHRPDVGLRFRGSACNSENVPAVPA